MDNIYKLFKNYSKNYKNDLRLENIKKSFLNLFNQNTDENKKKVIIYGAGVITLPSILELLEEFKIRPVAIIDSDQNKWGRSIDGIIVNSLKEAYHIYGTDVTVIIAVRGNKRDMLQINRNLKELGYTQIIQCSAWLSYREVLQLKDYNLMSGEQNSFIIENIENILWLNSILEDELSKQVLTEIVMARINPFEYKYEYFETSYFPKNMFSNSAYSYVIDCGAYRGDTLQEFLSIHDCKRSLQEYHAFEIDPINIGILKQSVNKYDNSIRSKVYIHPLAVTDITGTIKICADGSIGSYIDKNGNMTINSVALDDIIKDTPVTLIKMDIEGSEQSALLGAQGIITKYRPILVISLYHNYKDLWEIPKFIDGLVDSYVGILRHQGLFEYIYFAIPKELYLNY